MQAKAEKRWYLVQCKPKQDLRALEHLQRQGYECVLPLHKVESLQKGKWQVKEEPLFPGYLFIELSTSHDSWMPISSTRGVSHIVRFGCTPQAVPYNIVERLRHPESIFQPALQAGDKIHINWVGTHNLEAIFLAKDGTERIVILLNILHRQLEISVPTLSVI